MILDICRGLGGVIAVYMWTVGKMRAGTARLTTGSEGVEQRGGKERIAKRRKEMAELGRKESREGEQFDIFLELTHCVRQQAGNSMIARIIDSGIAEPSCDRSATKPAGRFMPRSESRSENL